MKRIVSVLGARPQFVKAAVLSRIIRDKKEIEEIIVHTGQHYDDNMSQVFFDEMHIPKPKYNLNINGLTHGAMTGQMLERIEEVLLKEKPDVVIVYGDTNSTLAGALAAKKLGIKVAHIEAGLRSFNMEMPEEINRILTDRISDLLICPSKTAVENLKNEGIPNVHSEVVLCGDIMRDSVEYYGGLINENQKVKELPFKQNSFVLATIHREDNTDQKEKLQAIFKALDRISDQCPVLMPIHPRTKAAMDRYELKTRVRFVDPLGYFDLLNVLKNCRQVITDSGGLQKEAYFCNKPCIIARNETEWVELVEHGYALICGSDSERLYNGFLQFDRRPPSFTKALYGKQVGSRIYQEILLLLNS